LSRTEKSQKNQEMANQVLHIEIRIEGCLDPRWTEWFEGLKIEQTTSGETTISGEVVDQAALYGLIGKLRDLGVRLHSIKYGEVHNSK